MHAKSFYSGHGDRDFIDLLNASYAHFTPTADIPNLSMLIDETRDTFMLGHFWKAFWIQNSYGFDYNAIPFLPEPFFTILQKSMDLFWDRIGDGVRTGLDPEYYHRDDISAFERELLMLVAPDGALGDSVFHSGIAYRQGDCEFNKHDWFYEATAAGLLIQAEILLRKRDAAEVNKYLPKMMRSCDFIERARDENGLFLVGPACNLLAPSFGAAVGENGEIEKSYLAGITVTFSGALARMIEIFKLAEQTAAQKTCEERLARNMETLPLLLTDEGYFVKSLEKNGTKHGVYGAEKFGYFESVVNVDAIAIGVADQNTAEKIYEKIASIEGLRPAGFLANNYPGLDDMYMNYGSADLSNHPDVFLQPGCWVNGGVWGTVEGRTILAYFKLNKFEDAVRSANWAYEWTKNYRMDAPFSEWGANTRNLWSSDARGDAVTQAAVMGDNLAIPAAVVRGLFDYEYAMDTLKLTPHLPPALESVTQKRPVFWGGKEIYISCTNGEKITGLTINGRSADCFDGESVYLDFDSLPRQAMIGIEKDGQKPDESVVWQYRRPDAGICFEKDEINQTYRQVSERYEKEPSNPYGQLAMDCAEALYDRIHTPFDASNETLRPMTDLKKSQILDLYEYAFLRTAKLFLANL